MAGTWIGADDGLIDRTLFSECLSAKDRRSFFDDRRRVHGWIPFIVRFSSSVSWILLDGQMNWAR